MKHFEYSQVQEFIIELFKRAGLNNYCSERSAKGVILASLRGVDSHGIQLVPHYIKEIESGRVNKVPKFEFTQTSHTTCVMDADNSMGFSSGVKAVEYATERAKIHGMASISVQNSTHCGMLAYYTIEAARNGMFSLAMTNTTPRLIPPNGKSAFLGTNPISWAVPVRGEDPICYDAATTQITGNKVKLYKRLGKKLPKGLAADLDGNPTVNPEKAKNLYAFGGYKGFGISMLIDILCGALSGMPNSEFVTDMYGSDISKKRRLGQFFILLDIEKFRPLSLFTNDLYDEVKRLRSLRNNGSNVRAPGDIEKIEFEHRKVNGIPIDNDLLNQFSDLAKNYKITPLIR